MTQIEIVVDDVAIIGEQPTWSVSEQAIYWIDIKACMLHRLHIETGKRDRWMLGEEVGAFALGPDPSGAVVALRTGLYHLDLNDGSIELLAPPPYDPAFHRFNEGGCDPQGRFWIGVMFDPLQPNAGPTRPATLSSYTSDGGLRREADAAVLHNGMAWSADRGRFFLSHSEESTIYVFELDRFGAMGVRIPFATIPQGLGLPDGAAIDTNGGYWCALHGGGRLRRYHSDGSHDRDIPLPVSKPTMCGFGGEALDFLYVTTASEGLGAEQRAREPHAGALLRLRPGEIGIARRCSVR